MPKYVVKFASVLLPMPDKASAAPSAFKGQTVELDEKVAQHYLDYDAIEPVAESKKAETKSADEKPATTRGRASSKSTDS